MIQLFPVLFCVVTAVHKFDFRPVITNGNQWEDDHAMTETH